MSDKIESAIEEVVKIVETQEREIREKKRVVNSLCALVGKGPRYTDEELTTSGQMQAVATDEYYGREVSDVIEDILKRRKAAGGNGPASVAEIYEAMKAGGYRFNAKSDENAKRPLYISLGKNPKFHRLPNGDFGLTAWYPAIREAKPKNVGRSTAPDEESIESEFSRDVEDPEGTAEMVAEIAAKPR